VLHDSMLASRIVQVPTSAFIVYVVSWTLRWARKHMGKNNLASKTLVDPHFLI
jgi:hypothetical protein